MEVAVMSIEAMKQALEEIATLRLAIEQAEKQTALDRMADNARELGLDYTPMQEPVAMRYDFDGYGYKYIDSGSGSNWQTRIEGAEPLYEAPPQRQPLTEEEIVEIAWDWKSGGPIDFARAIERKHGIGGGE
jgi:hypothetical protein